MPELMYIPLNKIRGNPVALRDVNRDSDSFMELVGSIKKDGVLNPINVRRKPGEDGKEFELVDGLQRYSASCEAGTGAVENGQGMFEDTKDAEGKTSKIGVIPAQVVSRDDADALTSQIIANAHKIETQPAEYSAAIRRYLGYNPTLSESALAAKLNKSPQWISKMLSLNKLHDQAKPLVNEGKISLSNAVALSKLPAEEQLNWLDRAQTQDAGSFSVAAFARVKEIRDANRKGQAPGEESFIPVTHLRKKPEIEKEMEQAELLAALIRDQNITKGIKPNNEGLIQAAVEGAKLAMKWVLNFDPASIEAQKARDAARRKTAEEEKIRRKAEQSATKEKEAVERAEKAREAAAAAKAAAEALPPAPATT